VTPTTQLDGGVSHVSTVVVPKRSPDDHRVDLEHDRSRERKEPPDLVEQPPQRAPD
jgi:hypothetical protein